MNAITIAAGRNLTAFLCFYYKNGSQIKNVGCPQYYRKTQETLLLTHPLPVRLQQKLKSKCIKGDEKKHEYV